MTIAAPLRYAAAAVADYCRLSMPSTMPLPPRYFRRHADAHDVSMLMPRDIMMTSDAAPLDVLPRRYFVKPQDDA